MPPLVCPRNDVWETSVKIPYWCRVTARPIRSTTQIWVVTRHQYAFSALVSQTLFRGGNRWWQHAMSAVFSGYSLSSIFGYHESGVSQPANRLFLFLFLLLSLKRLHFQLPWQVFMICRPTTLVSSLVLTLVLVVQSVSHFQMIA